MRSVGGQFLRNAATSWVGMALGIAITFFFTPYLISELGKDRYGVWTLAFSLLAYMKLADLGMGQSIVRYISKHLASRDWNELNAVVSSATQLYVVVAGTTFAAALAIAFAALHLMQIPADLFRTTQAVVIILGIRQTLFFITLPFVSLGAFHRFDIINYFNMCGHVLQTVLMVVLLELGFGLVAMALLVLALDSVSFFWRHKIRRRLFPEVHFSRAAISSEKTRELMGYGLYSVLIMVAWTVILQTDNVVIASFISTEAVALYSIPGMMVIQLRNTVKTITVPLIPAISHYEALKDFAKIREVFARSTRYLYYVATFFCVAILFYGESFMVLWVGPDFASSRDVLHILMVGVTFTLPLLIGNAILLGISRHKLTFVLVGSEAVTKIILSIILVQKLGAVGVALGTAIPQLILYIVIYPIAFHRVLQARLAPFYKRSARSVLLAAVPLIPAAYAMRRLLPPDNWFALIADCAAVSAVMGLVLVAFILIPEDRTKVTALARRYLVRADHTSTEGPTGDDDGDVIR